MCLRVLTRVSEQKFEFPATAGVSFHIKLRKMGTKKTILSGMRVTPVARMRFIVVPERPRTSIWNRVTVLEGGCLRDRPWDISYCNLYITIPKRKVVFVCCEANKWSKQKMQFVWEKFFLFKVEPSLRFIGKNIVFISI